MEIFQIENLTFYYPRADIPAVKNFSLSIGSGEFFVLCGRSGCGKSTLLRQLKPQLAPCGRKSGSILFKNTPLSSLSERESAAKIGFVLQSPDNQIVTDKVWHELAFGMESLGFDTPVIRRRVAEMASFFGIQNWFYKDTSKLSGGQKQLLNLAAIMVMQPDILILDEPASQLDPIAASDFLATLKRISLELGTAVILTEHRLEEALPLASRAAVMENGQLLCCGSPAEIGAFLKNSHHGMFPALPAAMQIWNSVDSTLPCPISVNEGRRFLSEYTKGKTIYFQKKASAHIYGKPKITADNIWFRYKKDLPDIIRGASLTVRAGEMLCILGGNGTGKTTSLKLLSGLYRPYRGEIKAEGRVCLLPQNPQILFTKSTVYQDLSNILKDSGCPEEQQKEKIKESLRLCRLSGLENRHPYDLSGGEQQRASLAKLLLSNPDILLLDEPTKGLDAEFKNEFADILSKLCSSGICIVMVSHDIEFCAKHANRCALFFDGSVIAEGTPETFFLGNFFYTTCANRIARHVIPNAVTTEDVIAAINGRTAEGSVDTPVSQNELIDTPVSQAGRYSSDFLPNNTANACVDYSDKTDGSAASQPNRLPSWKKTGGTISALFSLGILLYSAKTGKLSETIGQNGITAAGKRQLTIYSGLILFLFLTAAFFYQKADKPVAQEEIRKKRLPKRTRMAVILILLVIPATLFIGVVYMAQKRYYVIALAVLMECMLPFFIVFEGSRPKAGELVTIAVLCALGVAGRAAFFMLPQFKPVLALAIISGAALGGETGFLVGAVTMLVSNILFSQGPWTPWQMFAMGIIGFLAGILYQKGRLKSGLPLCVFGAATAIFIYGGIMNLAAALIGGGEALNLKVLAGYYASGFPMDCIHAAATAIFLWFITEPMFEKLERIKVKYEL